MRHYETGVIIAPNLSDEEIDQQIKQMAEVIASMKGNLHREERWGKRKLAYPIKKFSDGYYVFLHYESEANVPAELERRFRQSDQILRFLTVKKETGQRRGLKKGKKEAEEAPQLGESAVEAAEEKEKSRDEEKTKVKESGAEFKEREKDRDKDKGKEVL